MIYGPWSMVPLAPPPVKVGRPQRDRRKQAAARRVAKRARR